jgi:hypothetical protein
MNHKKIAFLAVATIALICIDLYEFAFGLNKVHAYSGTVDLSGDKDSTL